MKSMLRLVLYLLKLRVLWNTQRSYFIWKHLGKCLHIACLLFLIVPSRLPLAFNIYFLI